MPDDRSRTARRVARRIASVLGAAATVVVVARPAAVAAQPAPAQPVADAVAACAAIADDAGRLACYDRAAGRGVPATGGIAPGAPAADGPPLPLLDETARAERDARRALGSSLGERWELDPGTKQGRYVLRPYKPMYVLPLRWSSDPNEQPTSDGQGNSLAEPVDLRSIEAEFQISLKSKIWETIAGTNVDLWLAYTQSSHWQVYSPQLSRPFRETNYEPEVFAIWGFDQPLAFGWRARFLGLGINHQSNGRNEPASRSWNRIIAQAGFERGDWSVLVRPWWRLREDVEDDDNPGIEDWIGRGELIVTRRAAGHVATLQLRHSLRGGDRSRGSLALDWAYPLSSYLKGHLRVSSGYGETLIDFNHRQTTIGLGVSLVEWQ